MSADLFENETISKQESHIGSRQAFARLLPFLKNHIRGLVVCLVLLAGATGLSLLWPLLLRRVLDVNIAAGDFKGLLWTVAAIALIQLSNIGLQYTMRVKLEVIGQDVMLELKRKLYHHILSLDVPYFERQYVMI